MQSEADGQCAAWLAFQSALGGDKVPTSGLRLSGCKNPILRPAREFWARVRSGHIAAAPPASAMNSRRLIRSPPMRMIRVSDAQAAMSIAAVRRVRPTEVRNGSWDEIANAIAAARGVLLIAWQLGRALISGTTELSIMGQEIFFDR